jgi:DNA-binding NarL/FixJ family response regulator
MSAQPATIRVVVVDDHPIVRQGLVTVLGDEPDFTVAGAAGSTEEALPLIAREQPDVVLLDLELPGLDGVAAVPRIAEISPGARVIVFTAYDTDERVFGALRAGAKGYLLKGASTEELARAIHAVHAGGSHLEPRVAARVLAEMNAPRRHASELSERETAVLRLVATGLSNKEIGRSLSISERTVRFHITSILNKLGAATRAQAVALATQRGML